MKFICRAYRFGTYNSDGSLDYGLHLVYEETIEKDVGVLPDLGTRVFETTVKGVDLPMREVCDDLYEAIPREVMIKLNHWYSGICSDKLDVISATFGGWTYFRYTSKGCWPSFARRRRFSFADQMEFAEKERYFALWDNVTGWFDPRDEDTLHLRPSRFRQTPAKLKPRILFAV